MKYLLLSFLILFTLSINVVSQEEDVYKVTPNFTDKSKKEIYVPKDLDDSFVELKKMLHPKFIEKYKKGEIDPAGQHFGLGLWMRNNWKLWGGGRLAKYFNKLGIFHPDDMSGIILDTFKLHLNNKPLEVDKKIQYYKDYWYAAKRPTKEEAKFEECPKGVKWKGSFNPPTEKDDEKHREIHYGHCKADKKIWVFERGKGWSKPTKEMLKIINSDDSDL